jgi:hypothetical protein
VLAGLNKERQGNHDVVVWAYSDHNTANRVNGGYYSIPVTAKAWLAHRGLIDEELPGSWGAIPRSLDLIDPEQLEVLEVAEGFARALAGRDEELYTSLFVSPEVPFVSPIPARNTTFTLTAQRFYGMISSSPEVFAEVMRGIEIRVDDGMFAYLSFDFQGYDGGVIYNWGREYWALVKTAEGWKISSVTWTQNMVSQYR